MNRQMQNWIPYQINKTSKEWEATWLCLGDHLFREPFFEQSIRVCQHLDSNRKQEKLITSLAELKQVSDGLECIAPTAFIFHISRCGSTLMTQLLSLNDENIVISEAPVLDTILRWKFNEKGISALSRGDYLSHTTRILGQKRFDFQQRYFIKWDSWHLFFLDEIRRLFPHVPFIFLTREKEKVLDSHQKIPGIQAIRGVLEPEIFGYDLKQVLEMTPVQYMDNIISKMICVIHDFIKTDRKSLLLPYENGVRFNYEEMLAYLNIPISESERIKLKERLKKHSKRPNEQFEPVP